MRLRIVAVGLFGSGVVQLWHAPACGGTSRPWILLECLVFERHALTIHVVVLRGMLLPDGHPTNSTENDRFHVSLLQRKDILRSPFSSAEVGGEAHCAWLHSLSLRPPLLEAVVATRSRYRETVSTRRAGEETRESTRAISRCESSYACMCIHPSIMTINFDPPYACLPHALGAQLATAAVHCHLHAHPRHVGIVEN